VSAFVLARVDTPVRVWATAACGVAMSLWSTLFLEAWKQAQARAKMEWGMTGFEDTEQARRGVFRGASAFVPGPKARPAPSEGDGETQDRTEFEGKTIHSPVTGLPEKYFPDSDKARLVMGSRRSGYQNIKAVPFRGRFEACWRSFDDVSSTRVEARPKEFVSPKNEPNRSRRFSGRPNSVADIRTGSYVQVLLCMTYVSCVNAGVFYTYAYVSRWPLDQYTRAHPFFTGRFPCGYRAG